MKRGGYRNHHRELKEGEGERGGEEMEVGRGRTRGRDGGKEREGGVM